MKILEDLQKAKGYETFVATTFNADLAWFEALLLRQLRMKGVRRFLIFSDHQVLGQTLEEQAPFLTGPGRSYAVQPVKIQGSFHPKLFLLIGEKKARLYIGSGNLSRGGLDHNLEIFEQWDIQEEKNTAPQVFREVRSYLESILDNYVKHPLPIVKDIMNHAFGAACLSRPNEPSLNLEVWNSPGALFNRFKKDIPKGKTLFFVSPFFDEKGQMLIDLVKRLKVDSFNVITDMRSTNLSPEGFRAIRKAGGSVKKLDPEQHPRPLHAKLFAASGDNWRIGGFGSANASNAAWRGHNAELVVVRRGEYAQKIDQLIDDLEVLDLTSKDQDRLADISVARRLANNEEKSRNAGPRIFSAQWVSLSKIAIISSKFTTNLIDVEFANEPIVKAKSFFLEGVSDKRSKVEAVCPINVKRDGANFVRLLLEDETSDWAIVHDNEEIKAVSSRTSYPMEKLEELLDGDPDNFDGAQRYLEMLLKMYNERVGDRQKKLVSAKQPEKANNDVEGKPDLRKVNFAPISEDSNEANEYKLYGQSALLLSSRLSNKLLFGNEEAINIDAAEGESELEEDGIDDEYSKPKAGQLINKPKRKQILRKEAVKRQLLFGETMESVRLKYIKDLYEYHNSLPKPERLIDDLKVLAAPLHMMLRGNTIRIDLFRDEMVKLLRALLGGTDSPFIKSLALLTKEDTHEFWERSHSFLTIGLLLYNTCLANRAAARRYEYQADPSFPDSLPALWFRHIALEMQLELMQVKINSIRDKLPMLRCGNFWIADKFPYWSKQATLQAFMDTMGNHISILNHMDKEFAKLPRSILGIRGFSEVNEAEGEAIVYRPNKGSIGMGWMENERGLIQDNSFQYPAEGHRFRETMKSVASEDVVLLSKWEEYAAQMGGRVETISGLALMRKIIDQ